MSQIRCLNLKGERFIEKYRLQLAMKHWSAWTGGCVMIPCEGAECGNPKRGARLMKFVSTRRG